MAFNSAGKRFSEPEFQFSVWDTAVASHICNASEEKLDEFKTEYMGQ